MADALSCKDEDGTLSAISSPIATWFNEVKADHHQDPDVHGKLQKLKSGSLDPTRFKEHGGLLFYEGRLYLSPNSSLKDKIIHQYNYSPMGGNSGFHKTMSRLKADFYWQGMKNDVRKYVWECDNCQRHKGENTSPAGLLHPLLIPNRIWTEISMDFIDGLPSSHGRTTIIVVVDRLSKYAHFIPLSHPYTAALVARLFLDHVFKLHGMPTSIVSDCDPTFTSAFGWNSSSCRVLLYA